MQLRRLLTIAILGLAAALLPVADSDASCSDSAIARIAAGEDYDTPFVDFSNPRRINALELRELARKQTGDARVEMMRIKPVETTPFVIDGYINDASPRDFEYHADVPYQLTITAIGGSLLAELPVPDCTHGEVKARVTAARTRLMQSFADNKGRLDQQKVRIVGLGFYGTRAFMLAPTVDIVFDPPDFDMAFKRLPPRESRSALDTETARPGGRSTRPGGGKRHEETPVAAVEPRHKSRPLLFLFVLMIVGGIAWFLTRR